MTHRTGPQDTSGKAHPTIRSSTSALDGALGRTGSRPTVRVPAPPDLQDVALTDARSMAAAGCMSLSAFYDALAAGEVPPPVIRAPRCTRWRLTDAREWLRQRAERGSDPAEAAKVQRAARLGAEAAAAKRAAQKRPAAGAWKTATPA